MGPVEGPLEQQTGKQIPESGDGVHRGLYRGPIGFI